MEKTEQPLIRRVVLDAGPIIHLDEIGCLNLLSGFDESLVPESVWKEVEHHRPSALQKTEVTLIKTHVGTEKIEQVHILSNAFNLDAGEKEALSLCIQHPSSILLTDDTAARLAAKSLNIRSHGTIGILLRAIRRNQLKPTEVIRYLEQIPLTSTLFIKKSFLNEIIDIVKNEHSL
jgi:predicted nucleic acid-binding protein